MKAILSILLIVAIIGQSFVNVGIGIYYHLNKEYISKQLCENRNNPAIHCNGHCYLSKQLKNAEERDHKNSTVLRDREEIVSTEPAYSTPQIFLSESSRKIHFAYAATILLQNHHYGIIKPPEAA